MPTTFPSTFNEASRLASSWDQDSKLALLHRPIAVLLEQVGDDHVVVVVVDIGRGVEADDAPPRYRTAEPGLCVGDIASMPPRMIPLGFPALINFWLFVHEAHALAVVGVVRPHRLVRANPWASACFAVVSAPAKLSRVNATIRVLSRRRSSSSCTGRHTASGTERTGSEGSSVEVTGLISCGSDSFTSFIAHNNGASKRLFRRATAAAVLQPMCTGTDSGRDLQQRGGRDRLGVRTNARGPTLRDSLADSTLASHPAAVFPVGAQPRPPIPSSARRFRQPPVHCARRSSSS